MMQNLFDALPTSVKTHYTMEKTPFDIPRLPEAQVIVIPVIRETIAPMLIRNNDADMVTDQFIAGKTRVRMIASKTKGVERRRGAQILRTLGPEFGGRTATNKAFIHNSAGAVFDLNDYVFGNSANGTKKAIYPVHAAVLYSDAISLQTALASVEDVFRHGGVSDDGGAFDAEVHRSSANIFTTRSVAPGTLFVQTLVVPGRRLTRAGLDHLLLALGLAGAYGGSTATTGTNLATHLAGIYWGRLERPLNAPDQLLRLTGFDEKREVSQAIAALEMAFQGEAGYPNAIGAQTLQEYVASLVRRFEDNDADLVERYRTAAGMMRDLFDAWFTPSKSDDGTDNKKSSPRKRKSDISSEAPQGDLLGGS